MIKHTSNDITNQNQNLHATEIDDEIAPGTLEAFFQKMIDNSTSQLYKFELFPDLDNPSLEIQLSGIWEVETALFDSSRITSLTYHFSLDGTFSDVTGSPFSNLTDLNSAITTNVTNDTTWFFLKVGGTISVSDKVDVYLRMNYQGTSI